MIQGEIQCLSFLSQLFCPIQSDKYYESNFLIPCWALWKQQQMSKSSPFQESKCLPDRVVWESNQHRRMGRACPWRWWGCVRSRTTKNRQRWTNTELGRWWTTSHQPKGVGMGGEVRCQIIETEEEEVGLNLEEFFYLKKQTLALS